VLLDVSGRDGASAGAAPPLVLDAASTGRARTERVVALDGLRGLMAWAVALYHFGLLAHAFPAGTTASGVVTVLGLHSVEAFFIVSGFCLFHLHGGIAIERAALRDFYARRFARIAPVFYLVLAINLACRLPVGPPFSWLMLIENLTFTFGLHHPNYALVVGGWSIGLEMLFYASFPFLAWLFRSPGALAAGAVATLGLAWSYSVSDVEGATDAARFNAYVTIQNHAFAFLLGGLIAKLRPVVSLRVTFPFAFAALGIGLVSWIRSKPTVIDHFDVVLGLPRAHYVAAATLCIALAVLTQASNERVRVGLSWIGELSYPVYLIHPLAWLLCRACLPSNAPPLAAVSCALATTLGLALAIHHFFERPVRSWLLGTVPAGRVDRRS
jgi:peptidoglycan/LPS O-acetylase OafA/YrhL